MVDACGPYGVHPSLPKLPLDAAQLSHFFSPSQYPAFGRPHLTSYLQFCDVHDLTATMASGREELDMETFQRLSDSYQADVQVRPSITINAFLFRPDFDRDLSSVTDIQYKP